MESDVSDYDDQISDSEFDDKKHSQLIENVLNLNKSTGHVKKATRTEPTLKISEFNLVKSLEGQKGQIELNELTRVLKTRSKHVAISKKVDNTKIKSKTLPKPLEKPQEDRIKRVISYEKARLHLDRWDAFVHSNRAAAHLSFPFDLNTKLKPPKKDETNFRLKSDLQKKLEEIEPEIEEVVKEPKKFPLSYQEILEQRREMAKLRAHQSYREAKARQQSKIKSKKFHRIQRRQRIKETLKEFELLQKTNPEEALRKLDEIEKVRAEERMSLRHKSTGKWARSKQIRAKYDKDTRKELAEQLRLSKDLTEKVRKVDSSSESEDEEVIKSTNNANDTENPWQNGLKTDKEIDDFVSGYRKYWENKNKNAVGDDNIDNNLEAKDKGHEDVKKKDGPNETSTSTDCVKNKNVENKNAGKKEKSVNLNSDLKIRNKRDKKIKKSLLQKESFANEQPTVDKDLDVIPKNINKRAEFLYGWTVTDVGDKQSEEIDDIFDKLEEKLSKKAQEKYERIKNNLGGKQKMKTTQKSEDAVKKVDLSMPRQTKKPIIDEELLEQDKKVDDGSTPRDLNVLKNILSTKEKPPEDIDPNKFIEAKPVHLENNLPDLMTTFENEENTDQKSLIIEAFEDDDVIEEFNKEKTNEIEKDTPKDVDLCLPGWGSWGGKNLKVPEQKRKRFILKFPKKGHRRDENKGNLIINEDGDKKAKEHLVSDVPFPFTTVKDYEASIRAPIGNTFVPETAFRKLTRPAVKTKMGTIIEPMNESMLVKRPKVA